MSASPDLDRMRRRIAAAIACVLPACADRGIVDDVAESGAESTSAAAPETTGSAESTGHLTGMNGTSDETTTDDGDAPKFDLGTVPDAGPLPPPDMDCGTPPRFPAVGECGSEDHDGWAALAICVPAMPGVACDDPSQPDAETVLFQCAGCLCPTQVCGPLVIGDACCYWGTGEGQCCPGRPFVVDGHERRAVVVARADWSLDVEPPGDVPPALRHALATAWAEDARCEHAAVASFARFVLHLLSVGAPADLVARAQRAAADELAHARAFFGLASAYAGRSLGPGPLAVDGALAGDATLAAIVAATVREGCIAETISYLQLSAAHTRARDPAVRSVLAAILDEELAHVELAWAFVAWALEVGGEDVRRSVASTFAVAETAIPRRTSDDPASEHLAAWADHGRLTAEEAASLAREALAQVVRPMATRMLAGRETLGPIGHHGTPAALG